MKTILRTSIAGTALLFATHTSAVGQEELSFYDEFQGSSLNPAFRVLNPDRRRMALSGGEYLLLVPHKDRKNMLEYVGELPESYSATMRVQEPPNYHSQYVKLRAGDLQNNVYTSAFFCIDGCLDGMNFNTNQVLEGEEGQPIIEYSAELTGNPFYLRLVRKGVEYEGFYSADGARWSSVGKRVLINPSAGLFIEVAAWAGAPETPIKIDSFELTEILD